MSATIVWYQQKSQLHVMHETVRLTSVFIMPRTSVWQATLESPAGHIWPTSRSLQKYGHISVGNLINSTPTGGREVPTCYIFFIIRHKNPQS